ncbi:hypothetical protein AB0I84_04305 [Streptomyces spectabilis]|uniref:hypothetical protein n=1 Tax=Streptomyces spectabilis TaxID=68270 RepID=UPI0033EE5F04
MTTVRAITQGERELRDWHRSLRIGAATAGFGMMLASLYQLHWAGGLIGFPTLAAAAMAGSLELLLAFNAGAVTSIRKRTAKGAEGGYYWSLWCIFAFLLCISIAANVGHAMVALSEWFSSGDAPVVMAENRVYVYVVGSAVAAMVPLGGSFGLHISGFVRARGAGSDWVDEDGTGALLEAGVTAPAAPVEVATGERSVVKVPATGPADLAPQQPREAPMAIAKDEAPGRPEPEPAAAPEADSVKVLSEKELYAIYKAARDADEQHRFGPRGDLNPTQLGRRLGQSPQNGRKNVGPRFDSRYRAEKQEERGDGVDLSGLEAGNEATQAS